ncbi:GyrI-like domain-containing protein [Methanomethylovorans sp.]|uniref:GyrI-like domain-containing protein n=1 Tax=Methanomethylovorans sp. TaxID=2758717 RepID=UPI00351C412D
MSGDRITTIDLKKELKQLYSPSAKEVSVVEVPPMSYLMINGMGDPNTSKEYTESIEALYAMSYALKFLVKKSADPTDYIVMPLEGLWWADNMAKFCLENKDTWKWTSMIMQPSFVTEAMVSQALEQVEIKQDLSALSKMRFEKYDEGLSAQIMHVGPYSAETPIILKLHRFIEENGYSLRGKHHEIYLSDPGKTAPDKLKTVIRQPMK